MLRRKDREIKNSNVAPLFEHQKEKERKETINIKV